MIFKENQKVEIIKIDGLFEEIKKNDSLKLIKFNHNIEFIKWSDQIKGNYNNKIRLAETIQYEIKRNKENNSDVKANYPLE